MKLPVLDHGYVEFIEAWGHGKAGKGYFTTADDDSLAKNSPPDFEAGIIEAARQSTQGSFRGWGRDEKLLHFLYNNDHATPFEFAGMVIEVQAPIFVFREWQRHRTQSYNEMSARYEPLPDLYYIPSLARLMMDVDFANKQAGTISGATALTPEYAEAFRIRRIQRDVEWQAEYEADLAAGIPKELARGGMPVEHYSRMRATTNLRNWLAFLLLRLAPAAQWEIQQFAQAVGQIIAEKFPRTWELFEEGNKSE